VKLHFLVEGVSEQRLLEGLLPRLIPGHRFQVYPHQGKGTLPEDPIRKPDPLRRGLLDQLPAKLRAWRKLSADTDRVVILLDVDNEDCKVLLARIREMMEKIAPVPQTLVRLAREEVEAWYLGDVEAIRHAFGQVRKSSFKDYKQDSICGTSERFQKVIEAESDDKVGWAARMGGLLDVEDGVNQSTSYRKFCQRVREWVGDTGTSKAPRPRAGRNRK